MNIQLGATPLPFPAGLHLPPGDADVRGWLAQLICSCVHARAHARHGVLGRVRAGRREEPRRGGGQGKLLHTHAFTLFICDNIVLGV